MLQVLVGIWQLIPKWLIGLVAVALAGALLWTGSKLLIIDIKYKQAQVEVAELTISNKNLEAANKELTRVIEVKNKAVKDWEAKYKQHQAWAAAEVAKQKIRADANRNEASKWREQAQKPASIAERCQVMIDAVGKFIEQQLKESGK